jgi:NAD(P)-dependent dehydrogenase (short-subunit alcohol dehydrogenase family)
MSKIALVNGSSRGLGKRTALNLAKRGIDPIVIDHRSAEETAKVVAEIEALGVRAEKNRGQHRCSWRDRN